MLLLLLLLLLLLKSLALPYAFYQAGILCGTLLLLISAWATSTSIGLLVEACAKYKLSSYEKIVERGLGYKSRRIVEISILIFCCGTGTFLHHFKIL